MACNIIDACKSSLMPARLSTSHSAHAVMYDVQQTHLSGTAAAVQTIIIPNHEQSAETCFRTCEARSLKLLDVWVQTLCHCKQIIYTLVQQAISAQNLHFNI